MKPAFCRRRSHPSVLLPPPRLGNPHPGHSHCAGYDRCWQLPLHSYDQEQPQEGPQSTTEEGELEETRWHSKGQFGCLAYSVIGNTKLGFEGGARSLYISL